MNKIILAALTALIALAAPAAAHADNPHDGMRHCGTTPSGVYQVRAPKTTSCPFAMNTMRAVRNLQQHGWIGAGDRFVATAHSPVTRRSYLLNCTAAPSFPLIDCYGTRGARGIHVQMVSAG
jgi:opacity protein-like surface antigen